MSSNNQTYTLYAHQKKALKRMKSMENEKSGGVLAFSPGLGKTLTMAHHIHHNPLDHPTLVICPVSLLDTWTKEILKVSPDASILVYHGKGRKLHELISGDYDYIISTYTIMSKQIGNKVKKETKQTRYTFQCREYSRIVLDEAQQIRNGWKTSIPSVARAAFNLSPHARYKWCITGTPFNNCSSEFGSFAAFIGDPEYIDMEGWKKDVYNVKEWCDKYFIVQTKDGIIDKPEYHDIEITPTKKEVEVFNELKGIVKRTYDSWEGAEGKERKKLQGKILGMIATMRQCANTYYITQYNDVKLERVMKNSSKVKKIVSLARERVDNDPTNSFVIFSQFTRFLHLLKRIFAKYMSDVKVYIFTGSCSASERNQIVKDFREGGDEKRILLISLFSGGTGLTLLPCASILLCEGWFNPFVEIQAENRVHRLGQKHKVHIYRITMLKSIEPWVQAIKSTKLFSANEFNLLENAPAGQVKTFSMKDLQSLFREAIPQKNEK